MTPIRTLLRHTSHYAGGRVAIMLLGFASFPIFTRVFSVADYAALSLIQSAILVLTVVAKFGFQNSVQRYYTDYAASSDSLAFRRYYSTLFFGTALLALAVTAAFIGAVALGLGRFLGMAATGTLLVAGLLILVRALRSMQLNLLQMDGKTKLYNAIDILQKAAGIGIIILLLLFWRRSIAACFIGMVAAELAVLLHYVPVLARRGLLSPGLFDVTFLRAAVAFSFPLMVSEISWVALAAGDRFFVQHYLGLVPVGYYAAACGIAVYAQEAVTKPLDLSFFPVCMKLWAAKGREATQEFLTRSLSGFVMVAVLVVAVTALTAREVIVILASSKYQEARSLLPYLIGGLLLSAMSIFFRPGLMIHHRAGKIARATFFASLLNVVLNIALLPRLGLTGAAIANVLSFLGMAIYTGVESMRLLPFRIEWLALVRYATAGGAAFWIVSLISIENPVAGALVRALSVFIVYLAILWLIDARMREIVRRVTSLAGWDRRQPAEQPVQALPLTVE